MSKFAKRFQFARQNTSTTDSVNPVELDGIAESSDRKGSPKGSAYPDDKGIGLSTAISVEDEAVTAHRLSVFKQEAKWDPNLDDPNDIFAEIDENIHEHNATGEHALVDRLLENSPYLEVIHTNLDHLCTIQGTHSHVGPRSCSQL